MATVKSETYHCDRCSKKLPGFRNNLDIVTPKDEEAERRWDRFWARFHVKIQFHHGVDNKAEWRDADLCKACAVFLLFNALRRVRAGERASKGAEGVDEQHWV